MTLVKICGITNAEDAEFAVRSGADALGFNFYTGSPRYIDPLAARVIVKAMPAHIICVGVFVNEPLHSLVGQAIVSGVSTIQLHGDETPEFVREVKIESGLSVIKAFRVSPDFRPEDVLAYKADAILLDTYSPAAHGGTGEAFNWEIAAEVKEIFPKVYLAGGLGPSNVAEAIRVAAPYGVDACSLLESEKGRKNEKLVDEFVRNAQ